MEPTLYILLALVLIAFAAAYAKSAALPLEAVKASGRLLGSVWLELALGFLLAGLVDVLVPQESVARWLGAERLHKGILAGWVAGLVMPGGPYLFFPIAAKLLESGASPGALISFLTAKTLLSPVRTLAYEAPLLGWPLTLARLLPSLLLPPLLGLIGHWLYLLMKLR
jgi:uncharacterized membrane protein YraQ (UPF0718 family)